MKQWMCIRHEQAHLAAVVTLTVLGFLVVRNRSPKRLARLKHSMTIKYLSHGGFWK